MIPEKPHCGPLLSPFSPKTSKHSYSHKNHSPKKLLRSILSLHTRATLPKKTENI